MDLSACQVFAEGIAFKAEGLVDKSVEAAKRSGAPSLTWEAATKGSSPRHRFGAEGEQGHAAVTLRFRVVVLIEDLATRSPLRPSLCRRVLGVPLELGPGQVPIIVIDHSG